VFGGNTVMQGVVAPPGCHEYIFPPVPPFVTAHKEEDSPAQIDIGPPEMATNSVGPRSTVICAVVQQPLLSVIVTV
jgi:hypothetical protein